MAKITLENVVNVQNTSVINDNFQKIASEFNDKAFYRDNPDGEPNQLKNDIDVNGHRIYNLPDPIKDHEPVTLKTVKDWSVGGQYLNTLRTPDPVNALPDVAGRKGRILSFDDEGHPVASFTAADSATQLRMDLLQDNGYTMIGGLVDRLFTYADLRAFTKNINTVDIIGEGIAGRFITSILFTGADNGGTLIVGADGRRWKRLYSGEAMASWFGVSVNNPDNAQAIMNALAAVNPLPVRLPSGVLNSGKVTFNSFDYLLGMGSEATTLRLKNGANSDLIYGANSDALWGTNSTDCIVAPRIEGLTVKGNRANNTSGTGVALYAERPIIHDLIVTDTAGTGMRTEWSNSASESLNGLEGRFSKIQIYRNGEHGWRFAGPHDSHIDDVVIFTNSLNSDRGFQNLWIEKGNARWSKVHSYSTADILPHRVQHSLLISAAGSGNEFTLSHFEGGATNVRIIGNNNIFDDSCRVYYPWDGTNIALAGNGNIINCYCGEEYRGIGLPAAKGVVFSGDAGGASGNYIDIVAGGCGGGSVDFGGSLGANSVRARGFNPLGTDVGFVGTPQASDEIDIRIIGGTKTTLRQQFGYYNNNVLPLAGFGATQADATQIPENVQIFNLNSGAAGSGVRLPNATVVRNGAEITIFNTTAYSIKVYPAVGGNIAGFGVNNPLTIGGLKTVKLIVIDSGSGQWGAQVGS